MFGKKKKDINKVVVSSKDELKAAVKRKEPYIEVHGDLARKMKWMGKISPAKVSAIIAILTPLIAIPGGMVTAPMLAATGALDATEIGFVIGIIGILGIATILGILKGYNVEIEAGQVTLRIKTGAR